MLSAPHGEREGGYRGERAQARCVAPRRFCGYVTCVCVCVCVYRVVSEVTYVFSMLGVVFLSRIVQRVHDGVCIGMKEEGVSWRKSASPWRVESGRLAPPFADNFAAQGTRREKKHISGTKQTRRHCDVWHCDEYRV